MGRAMESGRAGSRPWFGTRSGSKPGWRRAAVGMMLVAAGMIAGAVFMSSLGHRPAAAITPYPHELAQVSFAVAGDVIPHEPVRAAAAAAAAKGEAADTGGWGALFADVGDVFEHADFGFVNLETPVAPAHSKGSRPFMFDAPVALVTRRLFVYQV